MKREKPRVYISLNSSIEANSELKERCWPIVGGFSGTRPVRGVFEGSSYIGSAYLTPYVMLYVGGIEKGNGMAYILLVFIPPDSPKREEIENGLRDLGMHPEEYGRLKMTYLVA